MDSNGTKAILIVEPSSYIRFRGPSHRPVSSIISLINPTNDKIIFKIKTSAPNFYGVRPNFGVVQPRNFMEVEILRQPFNYDPKERITHRFMVQSLGAPSDTEDIAKYWKNADPKLLAATKLRCIFELPQMQLKPTDLRLPDQNDIDSLTKIEEISSKESLLQRHIDTINSEIYQLRNENSTLRKENSTLKTEVQTIQNLTVSHDDRNAHPITIKEKKHFPFIYILSSVTLVVACILIGKFFL